MQIEFITSSRVSSLPDPNLFDFVLERVLQDKIVVLEKDLNYQQQMELIARALERANDKSASGIQFMPFYVKTEVNGIIRSKEQQVQFNLIAPGSSQIHETDDGTYAVTTNDGEVVSAAI